jgi:hypothetical protein
VHPASRAVPAACRANDAAPRAGPALPPRSRVAATSGAQRRADRGGQRVQPADQHALAPDLGVPEPGALLVVPVDAFLLGVDIDEGEDLLAGQQRRAAGQCGQQQPVHLPQLQHVTPGERAQERPQRGRRPDPAEQRAHRPVPQQVQVIDAVRPAGHPGGQAGHLRRRVHPAPAGRPHVSAGQIAQAPPRWARAITGTRPGPRHQIRVIKRCVDLRQAVQQSHLRGALSARDLEASVTPIVPVQRAPFASTRPQLHLFTRRIEAKRTRVPAPSLV